MQLCGFTVAQCLPCTLTVLFSVLMFFFCFLLFLFIIYFLAFDVFCFCFACLLYRLLFLEKEKNPRPMSRTVLTLRFQLVCRGPPGCYIG